MSTELHDIVCLQQGITVVIQNTIESAYHSFKINVSQVWFTPLEMDIASLQESLKLWYSK